MRVFAACLAVAVCAAAVAASVSDTVRDQDDHADALVDGKKPGDVVNVRATYTVKSGHSADQLKQLGLAAGLSTGRLAVFASKDGAVYYAQNDLGQDRKQVRRVDTSQNDRVSYFISKDGAGKCQAAQAAPSGQLAPALLRYQEAIGDRCQKLGQLKYAGLVYWDDKNHVTWELSSNKGWLRRWYYLPGSGAIAGTAIRTPSDGKITDVVLSDVGVGDVAKEEFFHLPPACPTPAPASLLHPHFRAKYNVVVRAAAAEDAEQKPVKLTVELRTRGNPASEDEMFKLDMWSKRADGGDDDVGGDGDDDGHGPHVYRYVLNSPKRMAWAVHYHHDDGEDKPESLDDESIDTAAAFLSGSAIGVSDKECMCTAADHDPEQGRLTPVHIIDSSFVKTSKREIINDNSCDTWVSKPSQPGQGYPVSVCIGQGRVHRLVIVTEDATVTSTLIGSSYDASQQDMQHFQQPGDACPRHFCQCDHSCC